MITNIDHIILFWIENNLRFDWLTPFWKFMTLFGEGGFFWIALCLLLIAIKKTRKIGILMAVALIINALLVNVCIKNVVARVRPYDQFSDLTRLIVAQKDYSFKSGHTSASFACAIGLLIGLDKGKKRYAIPAIVLACLIGFSRLYLGVHFPSDVLGGAIIGTLSALLAIYVSKYIYQLFMKKNLSEA